MCACVCIYVCIYVCVSTHDSRDTAFFPYIFQIFFVGHLTLGCVCARVLCVCGVCVCVTVLMEAI